MRTILTIITSIIGAFGVVVVAFGLAAHAQSSNLRANVPFDFWIGTSPMHAGVYTLQSVGVNPRDLLMQDDNGVSSGFLLTIPLDQASGSEAKLVFNRYGDQYFLSEIWNGSYRLGLLQSEKERRLMASNQVPAEVALIASR